MAHGLQIDWLGRVPYRDGLELQDKAVEARRCGAAGDRLLLLEHPPVITLGRRGDPRNLRSAPEELARRGVEVHRVARGGDVTWHGPGQLVGYLVADLAALGRPDAHRLLRDLEAALLDACGALGLAAGRVAGWTGVFVPGARPPRKLASIGVGLRGWISFHGFALNVTNDPVAFADIVPCGLAEVRMTSLAAELGLAASDELFDRARAAVAEACARRFAADGEGA